MSALHAHPVKFPSEVPPTHAQLPESTRSYSGGPNANRNPSAESQAMKKDKNKILPFPPPAHEPAVQTIIAQIGRERFAIHFEFEDLPPAAPTPTPPPSLLLLKLPAKKQKRIQ
jgi:hypothetical protein